MSTAGGRGGWKLAVGSATFGIYSFDLYVMQNSRIAAELKIGRSRDVEARRRSLQASQNFKMLVLAVFLQAGHIETSVHRILS